MNLEQLTLTALLAQENPDRPSHLCARDAKTLMDVAYRVQHIAETQCNGIERYDEKAGRRLASWTDEDEANAKKELEKARLKVEAIASLYGATVARIGGDPRGFTTALTLKSGKTNSFGGEYWGIPTRS